MRPSRITIAVLSVAKARAGLLLPLDSRVARRADHVPQETEDPRAVHLASFRRVFDDTILEDTDGFNRIRARRRRIPPGSMVKY
jgi:hypothetical protein